MVQLTSDSVDSIRSTTLYEWTLTILVSNFTIQIYRLTAQLATFFFSVFKLSHSVDYFWPLTTDDLKPYTRHFITNNEILYKLGESLLLTITSFYGVHGLLDISMVALGINIFVFFLHIMALLFGLIFVSGKFDLLQAQLLYEQKASDQPN